MVYATLNREAFFSEDNITHLPRVQTDHAPILLNFANGNVLRRDHRPFHFQMMWFSLPYFKEFITKEWDGNAPLSSNTTNLASVLPKCNSTIFGNIFKRKR